MHILTRSFRLQDVNHLPIQSSLQLYARLSKRVLRGFGRPKIKQQFDVFIKCFHSKENTQGNRSQHAIILRGIARIQSKGYWGLFWGGKLKEIESGSKEKMFFFHSNFSVHSFLIGRIPNFWIGFLVEFPGFWNKMGEWAREMNGHIGEFK